MPNATLARNVREPKRNVREPKRNVREPKRNVREPKRENVRDLKGELIASADADLEILDWLLSFEDADVREHQACLPDPYPTATTRWGCEL